MNVKWIMEDVQIYASTLRDLLNVLVMKGIFWQTIVVAVMVRRR